MGDEDKDKIQDYKIIDELEKLEDKIREELAEEEKRLSESYSVEKITPELLKKLEKENPELSDMIKELEYSSNVITESVKIFTQICEMLNDPRLSVPYYSTFDVNSIPLENIPSEKLTENKTLYERLSK